MFEALEGAETEQWGFDRLSHRLWKAEEPNSVSSKNLNLHPLFQSTHFNRCWDFDRLSHRSLHAEEPNIVASTGSATASLLHSTHFNPCLNKRVSALRMFFLIKIHPRYLYLE